MLGLTLLVVVLVEVIITFPQSVFGLSEEAI
jgi:hypothetical protein